MGREWEKYTETNKKGRGAGEELRKIHILHPRKEKEKEIQEEAVKEGKKGRQKWTQTKGAY